jgi:hypothetical protein
MRAQQHCRQRNDREDRRADEHVRRHMDDRLPPNERFPVRHDSSAYERLEALANAQPGAC